ncbi:MAG: hypothetical protein AABZ08_00385 [Planctomycetota bacterium]
MALLDLWKSDRQQILQKRLQQLISFAGEGRLLDGNDTSLELRALLRAIPSELLAQWVDEILTEPFDDSGFALQDIVNEIGSRLAFTVEPGVYRGKRDGANYDGFWQSPEGSALVVESKTTTAYQINLTKIADYRKHAPKPNGVGNEDLAVLLVVGRDSTDAMESQIRGSRHAWSVRLIGIEALLRLVKLKETLNDSAVERQIRNILFPQEFTRLDRIVDLVFETTEDVQEEIGEAELVVEGGITKKKPAGFHMAILPLLERYVGHPLVKRARVIWASPEGDKLLSCQVASERHEGPGDALYWFGLKRKTAEILAETRDSLSAFGLGSSDNVVVIPFDLLQSYSGGFFTSPDESGKILHWHIRFIRNGTKFLLLTNRDRERLDVTKFLLQSKQK